MLKNIRNYLFNKKVLKYVLILTVIVLIIIGYGIYKTMKTKSASTEPVFNEVRVENGDLTIAVSEDGKANLSTLDLGFSSSGKLKAVYVTEGQKVKAGDLLAELDVTDLNNQLLTAQNDYNTAVVKLEQTKASHSQKLLDLKQSLDNSKSTVDKIYLDYYPMTQLPDAYTKVEIEQKKMEYDNAKKAYENQLANYNAALKDSSDIKLAQLNVESAQTKLKTIEDNIKNAKLIAPSDGVVLSVANKAGEVISENAKLIQLSTSQKINVTAQVSELDIPKIKIGQDAEVEFEAFSGKIYTGKVSSVKLIPTVDSSGIVNYDINVQLDDNSDEIKTGMNCTIKLILKQKKNVLIIPNKAVKMVNNKQVVYVKDSQGNKVQKEIKTGFTDGTNVEVVEGLKAGDIVFVEGKQKSR